MNKYLDLSGNDRHSEPRRQAINLATLGRNDEAIRILKIILKENPRDGQAWLWFARTSNELWKIAIALKNASLMAPGNQEIEEESKKLESAVASGAKKSSTLKHCYFCWAPVLKDDLVCHYCNAHLDIHEKFFHLKFYDHSIKFPSRKYILDAFQRYSKAVLLEPKVAFLHFCLAITHINLDQWDEAMDELLLAKSINPVDNPYESQLEILSDFMDDLGSFFAEDVPLEEKPVAARESKPGDKKILVVEDSATTRTIIRKMLNQKGYTVVEAKDGREALEKYDETAPDLILLDIIMPGMDGYQTLSVLKKSHSLGSTPVIMLSAKSTLLDKMKGKIAGSTEYLTKPFSSFQLMKKIERHLNK